MIYFLQPVDGGPVKIGRTDNLDARRKQLEAHYGCQLALLATMPGDKEEESEIHERFREIRFGRTEQYRPTSELMAFIGKPLLVGANSDSVEAMESHSKALLCAFKGSKAFADWFDELVAHTRLPATVLIEHSLVVFAKQHGFTKAPPER